MINILKYKRFIVIITVGFVVLGGAILRQAEAAIAGGGEQPLNLTLRGALAAAVDNNPDVLLYKERIEAARGQVRTQLGAMLPNLSSNVRQSRQTVFQGTFGLSPVRSDPFSIFDARVNASQNF
jgi:outer membrane protein TolC